MRIVDIPPSSAEIVWNGGPTGTAVTANGRTIRVGGDAWSAEELLLVAVGSGFMSAFLELAGRAGVTVLEFVSSSRLEIAPTTPSGCRIWLQPSVVLPDAEDPGALRQLCDRAARACQLGRGLGVRLAVELDIRALPPRP